jgi:hypothetical protein
MLESKTGEQQGLLLTFSESLNKGYSPHFTCGNTEVQKS